MIKIILLILLIVVESISFAQENSTYLSDSLSNILESYEKQDDRRISKLLDISESLLNVLSIKEAYFYVSELENTVDDIDNLYYRCYSNYLIGRYYCDIGSYERSSIKLNSALDLLSEYSENDSVNRLKIKIHNAYGVIYNKVGMNNECYNQLQKGLTLNEKLQDTVLDLKLKNNLSLYYFNIKKYEESATILKKLLNYLKYNDDYYFVFCSNIAISYLNMNKIDSAQYYINLSEAHILNKNNQLAFLIQKGVVEIMKLNYPLAEKYCKQALDVIDVDTNDYKSVYANVLINLATIYCDTGLDELAMNYASQCEQLCVDIYDYKFILAALDIKIALFKKNKKFNDAFDCYDKKIILIDSMNNQYQVRKIDNIIHQHELEIIEHEYFNQQKITELRHKKEKVIMFLVISILALTTIVIVLLLNRKNILLKNKQIKEDFMSRELEIRNRELASNVVSLMQKNESFSNIIEKLMQINQEIKDVDIKKSIKKIAREIEKTFDGNFTEEFELRFRGVYSDFYDKLISKYPNLTNNEIRLCSFLKLNMSTKDISALTGQNPPSIDKARMRLRKKLGIDHDDTINLTTFIGKI